MDRQLPQKSFFKKNFRIILLVCVVLSGSLVVVLMGSGDRKQTVSLEELQIAQVSMGPFAEEILADGVIQPERVILIDAIESGRVEEKLVREGEQVEAGQVLLRMSNPDLQLQLIQREEQLMQEESQLINASYLQEKERITIAEQLNEIELQIKTAKRNWLQDSLLQKSGAISQHDYLKSRDEFTHLVEKKALLNARMNNEEKGSAVRNKQLIANVQMKKQNLTLARDAFNTLWVKAPASGQLSSFTVETGAFRNKGERLGQIDVTSGFKVRASIDEHYLNRIYVGQLASFALNGKSYPLTIHVIYPEIRNGKFEADLQFAGGFPEGLKRGQNIQVQIELSENKTAQRIPKGAFYQTSGGNWVYVVQENGHTAEKRNVKLGRQNQEYFEVIEGLQINDKVIISSYKSFGEYALLDLKK